MRTSTASTLISPIFATLLIASAPALAAITLGPGPVQGTDKAGWTFHEEFQDWQHADLRALDEWDSGGFNLKWWDDHDDGRDLVAFYHRLEDGQLYLRVDFLDLRPGWEGNVNLYLTVDCALGGAGWFPDYMDCQTDTPWEICLALYGSGDVPGTTYNLYDSSYGTGWNGQLTGSYWHTDLDAMECALPVSLLYDAGWNGSSAIYFQVASAKDFAEGACSGGGNSSDLADAFVDDARGCDDGWLNGGIASTGTTGRVQYASIAHGNQALGRGDELRVHVYDPESSTGIPGGTGFIRTLDTHRIFAVPLNIHVSGTLIAGLAWAPSPSGPGDPSDGPALLNEISQFVDANQADRPGALIGGVFAEHIMPYFEGPANAASFAVADSLHAAYFGLTQSDMKVTHTPERVIRSLPTGLSPLDGRTFEDLEATDYRATYLDAVGHLHHWFHPTETLWPDQPYRHQVHDINGVLCFMINNREDQYKFWAQDEGLHLDTRQSLLEKARAGTPQLVLVFDDWEALAGKSFGAISGQMEPNDNPIQYQKTIRWLANHPWIEIVTLAEMVDRADADPSWVIDHGYRDDLDVMSYHWLQHANEDSYHNWYYNSAGGVPGNEQSFYDLVPVITGEQGDYHRRGVGPGADGPPLPSGLSHGDLNTPGTLLYETWDAIAAAPPGGLRFLAEAAFSSMIYETAWHEEDNTDYTDSDGFGNWLYPDTSWDGLSTWALRLQNHARDATGLALAAAWADSVKGGTLPHGTTSYLVDADLDGIDEVVLRNRWLWTLWQDRGGRLLLAARFASQRQDAVLMLGNPLANPSAPGEEEYNNEFATRCSGFKVMNGSYADEVFAMSLQPAGIEFTSGDGLVTISHTLAAGSDTLATTVQENLTGDLYLRLGLSPNLTALLLGGPDTLTREYDGGSPETSTWYRLVNQQGGDVTILYDGASFNAAPLHAGYDRRDLAQTEEVELYGDGSFGFRTVFAAGDVLSSAPDLAESDLPESDLPAPPAHGLVRLLPARPNPFNPSTEISFELSRPRAVELSIHTLSGQRVRTLLAGPAPAGISRFVWDGRDRGGSVAASGLYLVRLVAGGDILTMKVLLLK